MGSCTWAGGTTFHPRCWLCRKFPPQLLMLPTFCRSFRTEVPHGALSLQTEQSDRPNAKTFTCETLPNPWILSDPYSAFATATIAAFEIYCGLNVRQTFLPFSSQPELAKGPTTLSKDLDTSSGIRNKKMVSKHLNLLHNLHKLEIYSFTDVKK